MSLSCHAGKMIVISHQVAGPSARNAGPDNKEVPPVNELTMHIPRELSIK